MLQNLRIDPEFESKIPPLREEELKQLEENILADGVVINPLIVWNGIIVDGHNRYRILQQHPEIQFTIYEKEVPDRYAVIAWICKNQLGRRNLTSQQFKYLMGQQYKAEKTAYVEIEKVTRQNQVIKMVCTPSRGQRNKSKKNISICLQITIMLFHRCQNAKVTLEMFRVVVMDITANHFHQFSTIRETLSIITLSLQDAPKSFHRAIVNAAANTRHTLYHASINQPLVEVSVSILKSTVTVEDRMRIRISLDCLCKSVEHKFVVVCIPNRKGNNTSVI